MKQDKLKIIFTNTADVPMEYAPQPASKFIPTWYKEMSSYLFEEKVPNGKGQTTGTIKRCMPVFDAINSGYIIVSPSDVWVRQASYDDNSEDKQPFYEWSSFGMIEFHPIEQAPTLPANTGHKISYPKWINPWSIKTPAGYSTIFVQPWHRESVFSILPGVVDTDAYSAPVNFPFVLNDIKFEGLIPAGTPIAQVIPFKRDTWEMQMGDTQDFDNQRKVSTLLKTKIFDSYKTQYRQVKKYD